TSVLHKTERNPMADESSRKPPGLPALPPAPPGPDEPGRLAEDDRGNITWQWANEDVLQADDTAGAIERLRVLVDPRLDVVDDDGTRNPVRDNPKGLKVGYTPYDSGSLGKTARMKKMDLRELSKWIDAKRKAEESSDPEE
ncbi:MAG: hypothetical protein QG571_437, partial [Pseudomonadota bacterium]|nr:hypothetical protein [Pseudomonadota bacterium]